MIYGVCIGSGSNNESLSYGIIIWQPTIKFDMYSHRELFKRHHLQRKKFKGGFLVVGNITKEKVTNSDSKPRISPRTFTGDDFVNSKESSEVNRYTDDIDLS